MPTEMNAQRTSSCLKQKKNGKKISKRIKRIKADIKLHLMFQIIRARAENDGVKDALLTRSLRVLMGKQNLTKS
ncbi:hypothetical protein OIU84_023899 [Salix udensis]|nr:hypothetical protein OIU84_023899 [Salix udensis]